MRLLFDENLSPRLVELLRSEFAGSRHLSEAGLRGATDLAVWNFARDQGLVIVSKDNDFRQRVFVDGPPPKVVWLSVGNAGTGAIAALLRRSRTQVERFAAEPDAGLLVLGAERETP